MGWLYCHIFSTTLTTSDVVGQTTGVMMKRYLSPPATFLALWVLALLFICSPVAAQTAGLGTLGLDDFLAETTGNVVCEDFGSLIDIDGNPAQPSDVPSDFPITTELFPSQSISLGQLSFEDTFSLIEAPLDGSFLIAFISPLDAPEPLVLELDPDLGKLEGFFVETGYLRISLFDGDTLLDNFPGVTADNSTDPNAGQVGWINTQGLNVTRVEFSAPLPEDLSPSTTLLQAGGLIGSLKASFLPVVEPPVFSPVLIIPMLVEDIEELIGSNDIGRKEGKAIQRSLEKALKNINKGSINKATGELTDANEQVLELMEDGSLSVEEGQAIVDMIELAIIVLNL